MYGKLIGKFYNIFVPFGNNFETFTFVVVKESFFNNSLTFRLDDKA